jgi:hypothetical protein
MEYANNINIKSMPDIVPKRSELKMNFIKDSLAEKSVSRKMFSIKKGTKRNMDNAREMIVRNTLINVAMIVNKIKVKVFLKFIIFSPFVRFSFFIDYSHIKFDKRIFDYLYYFFFTIKIR